MKGRELLVLVEEEGAKPAFGHTGLYHVALVVPLRVDLSRWLAHAARDRVKFTGVADHFVSEAFYLSDPDDHRIEIYWERPRAVWEGKVAARMTTESLDIDGLLGELDAPETEMFEGLPAGTTMGHVHLKVAEVQRTIEFYRDVLGFGLMDSEARLRPSPPADTTIISAPTPGRARGHHRHRPAPPPCATPPSSCRTARNGTGFSAGSVRRQHRKPPMARC